MAALSAQETKKAAAIAQYVEQIPAAAVTEMLERVLNYTGDEQRKVSQSVGRSVQEEEGDIALNRNGIVPLLSSLIEGLAHGRMGLGTSGL